MAPSSLASIVAPVVHLIHPHQTAVLQLLMRHAIALLALEGDAFVQTADDLLVSRLRDLAAVADKLPH
jgi:hypothetical protein